MAPRSRRRAATTHFASRALATLVHHDDIGSLNAVALWVIFGDKRCGPEPLPSSSPPQFSSPCSGGIPFAARRRAFVGVWNAGAPQHQKAMGKSLSTATNLRASHPPTTPAQLRPRDGEKRAGASSSHGRRVPRRQAGGCRECSVRF
ncbi:hypothetical protein BS78_01G391700 [Paspalum vaginatum]|nr:hypothetical protein BS78_01G391700 [Paspalum vaginatum]